MLSLAKVKSGAAAASYYEGVDDYYHQDRSPSQWQGQGAETLGLSGEVKSDDFRNLLDGKLPNGSEIHNAAEGRRGGTDLTFSAPKSVSIQALIGEDNRLIDAHDNAVKKALVYAQTLASYRITEDGVTQIKSSVNLIIATFRHDLSREADPQLHTHSVVINATQRPDGEWRALDQTEFYKQQKLLGAIYRSELALEVQRLGYQITTTHVDGRFELSHFNQQQIDGFSTRSQSIKNALSQFGKTRESATAKEKEMATLATRNAKGELNREVLKESWLEKSNTLGINLHPILEIPILSKSVNSQVTKDAVAFSVAHNTERQSIVTEAQLVQTALEQGTGKISLADVKTEIQHQSKNGTLIHEENLYTTEAAQQREKELLAVEFNGRNAVSPLINEQLARKALASTSLNKGQREAVTLIATTQNRVAAINGVAGSGKTTMLSAVNKIVATKNYEAVGVAPSAVAAQELGKTGIQSQTIASFLNSEKSPLTSKSILIVDEAGMVSAKDMHSILLKAEEVGAKVVLVGDTQQLKAVEAGRPFAQLQANDIAMVNMDEIQRQTNAELRNAVELASRGEVASSLNVLKQNVVEIDSHHERYEMIAKEYASLNEAERSNTLVLAGTNSARSLINENVRVELELAGKGVVVDTLERKDLTKAQAASSLSYQAGDIIQAQKDFESLGLKRGDLASVLETKDGKVILEKADGNHVEWKPAIQTSLTAYNFTERELSIGDSVRLTSNDYSQGILNGDRATVVAIDAEHQKITLTKTDGQSITLDGRKPLHLDHGYCSTVHSAQGQTAQRVLIDADAYSAATNESGYYVAISRAREEVKIYTDDKSMLPESISRESTKSAALDIEKPERSKSNMELEA
jgi:conjugative relaxase-like TrwC/TraI family protein